MSLDDNCTILSELGEAFVPMVHKDGVLLEGKRQILFVTWKIGCHITIPVYIEKRIFKIPDTFLNGIRLKIR